MSDDSKITSLSLREIAAWQLPYLSDNPPAWVGAIPSLQRGAVWKPGKIELFWDSVFRGFPVGSLVMCRELDGQASRFGKFGEADLREGVEKRHLLDGQQRCNAIAQGFIDPFGAPAREAIESILWIDLLPEVKELENTTRQFLFRVTTAAHPWGYTKADAPQTLSVRAHDEATEYSGWIPTGESPGERPYPTQIVPWGTVAPVPLAWLFLKECPSNAPAFWSWIRTRLQQSGQPWAAKVIAALESADDAAFARLATGKRFAEAMRLPALEMPPESIAAPTHSSEDAKETETNIANIEHLFVRLNNGGEAISADDLRYSMLKAYFPGVEKAVDQIRPAPMQPSRLVVLSARAATAEANKFPSETSIPALRALAAAGEASPFYRYFGIQKSGSGIEKPVSPMRDVFGLIEKWLLFSTSDKTDFGMPPVLRTSIAKDSQEVYLLLMLLAERVIAEGANSENCRKQIIGIATALHWFSTDKHKAVRAVHERLCKMDRISPECFHGILAEIGSEKLALLLPPESLTELLPEPGSSELWQQDFETQVFQKTGWSADDETIQAARRREWALICRVIWSRGMVCYSQRAWLNECFGAYDETAAFWDEHNCPWDWDHLLPGKEFYGKRNWDGLWACKHWGNTIGNFHILPFRENRSRADTPANQYEPFQSEAAQKRMLLSPKDGDLDAFSLKSGADEDTVLRFAKAAHRRIVRIYATWFDALDIGNLITVPAK